MIQNHSIEGNLTDTAAKATNSSETVKGAESTKQQRSRKASVLWSTVSKARRTFEKQLHKSNDLKRECLENRIPSVASDVEHFWSEYMDQANVLLDSKKFEKECSDLSVDPTILATHIVFLGSGTINKVLRNGIVNTIGSKYRDFNEMFVPKEADGSLVLSVDSRIRGGSNIGASPCLLYAVHWDCTARTFSISCE